VTDGSDKELSPQATRYGRPIGKTAKSHPEDIHENAFKEGVHVNGTTDSPAALITGAAHGIGRELAKVFAENGHDLVLVDLNGEALDEVCDQVTEEFGQSTMSVEVDLSAPDAATEVYEAVDDAGIRVEVLANNAGVGTYGPFHETNTAAQLNMMQVNMIASTHLTRLFLEDMVERGGGAVLNVSSTAAFNASPMTAVYNATKAYILLFSEAVAEELRETNVSVTVLCPGHTDTNFFENAGMAEPESASDGSTDPEVVARAGYRGMMKGKTVVFVEREEKFKADLIQMLPRSLVRRISARREQSRDRESIETSLAQRMKD
jgi:short-subunit dehydrogenase